MKTWGEILMKWRGVFDLCTSGGLAWFKSMKLRKNIFHILYTQRIVEYLYRESQEYNEIEKYPIKYYQ